MKTIGHGDSHDNRNSDKERRRRRRRRKGRKTLSWRGMSFELVEIITKLRLHIEEAR